LLCTHMGSIELSPCAAPVRHVRWPAEFGGGAR
jgi:hypothetical protein